MTELLKDWLQANEIKLKEKRITTKIFSEAETGMIVDLWTNIHLGRISLWESGLLVLDVMEIDSEENILHEDHQIENTADLDKALIDYLNKFCNE